MARDFDGTTDSVDFGDHTGLDSKTACSFLVWVDIDTITSGDMDFLSKWDTSQFCFNVQFDDVNGGDVDEFRVAVSPASGSNALVSSPSGSATVNTWYNIFGSYTENNASGLNGWLNGTAFADNPTSTSGKTGINNATSTLRNGGRASGGNDLNGQMSINVVWDIQITTTAHIQAMSRGANPFLFYNNNIVFFNTNEGNGTEKDYGLLGTGTVSGSTKATTNAPVEMLENYL